jgi:hypothetical protein
MAPTDVPVAVDKKGSDQENPQGVASIIDAKVHYRINTAHCFTYHCKMNQLINNQTHSYDFTSPNN